MFIRTKDFALHAVSDQ